MLRARCCCCIVCFVAQFHITGELFHTNTVNYTIVNVVKTDEGVRKNGERVPC